MATLVLGAIGTLIGGPIGGAVGALLGRSLDGMLFAPGAREGARLAELRLSTSSYGARIPQHFGRMRVPGQIIWATDLAEHKERQGGGKGRPSVSTYTYSASFAVALSSRPLLSIGRIWADGKLLRGEAGDLKVGGAMRFHQGHGDQAPDPLIASAEGIALCPAYRGCAYVMFEDLQLAEFGNRIPSLSFEVIADDGPLVLSSLAGQTISDISAPVSLGGMAGISVEGPLAETLAALDPFFPIDADACDEQLALLPDRRDLPPIALPEAATSSNSEDFGGKAGFARHRGGEADVPVGVLRYYDLDRDYQPGAQRAGGRPLPGQPRTIELPAALPAAEARRLVEQAAKRLNWNRQNISWRVTQLDPLVRPGATVTLPGHPGLWRVRTWEWREHGVDLALSRMPPQNSGAEIAADPGRISQAPDQAAGETILAACELPWDGSGSTVVPQVLALASSSSPAWPGASLFADHGDGALVPVGPTGRTRAIVGTAVGVLQPASPLLFDRSTQVDVILAGPDLMLANATMRQLSMGANRALLGNEIIQFANAVPLGESAWRLSGMWRGRGGTEDAVGQHLAGECFALLDGSGIALEGAVLGSTAQTRIAAIGLVDHAPVSAPIALAGIGNRPLMPVHPRCTYRPDGALVLRWTRRARGAWVWLDGVDVPLGEQLEAYAVTFGPAAGLTGGPVAQWQTSAPELVIAPAELAAILAAAPQGSFAVRQIGDRALSNPLIIDPAQP